MVSNTGTLMTMRIVRSKLRKWNESSGIAVNIESQQRLHEYQSRTNNSDDNANIARDQQILTTTIMPECNEDTGNDTMGLETITFARTGGGCNTSNGWVFPPKAPTPNIYNCVNHEAMVTVGERNGFSGLKKQFSGRFRRLILHKKDATSPIPPELKPQLKTIYVY